jgi:hypothetical protein
LGSYGGGKSGFGGLLGGCELGLKLGLGGLLGGRLGQCLSLCEFRLGCGELGFGLGFGRSDFGAEFNLVGLHQKRFELGEFRVVRNLRM